MARERGGIRLLSKGNAMTTYEMCETPLLTLGAKTAADMMVPHIVSVPVTGTLPEAAALLPEQRISAVPVTMGTAKQLGC
jgi:hypothetical protein